MKSIKHQTKQFFYLLLALFLLVINTGTLVGQEALALAEVDDLISKTSSYLTSTGDKTDAALKQLKFKKPSVMTTTEWRRTPAFTKVKLAYSAAENFEKGGGEKFLAMLSKNMAQEYESVNYEPRLKRYVNMNNVEFKGFAKPTAIQSIDLPDDIQKTISKLSKYTPGNRIGGVRSVLKTHFKLKSNQITQILNSSSSYEEALKKGYEKMYPPETRRKKLNSFVREVQSSYSSAKADPTLNKFLNESKSSSVRSNTKPSVAGSPSTDPNNRRNNRVYNPGSRTTSTPSNQINEKTRVNNLRSFEQRNIPSNGRGFRSIIRNINSQGGVIFGNSVEKDSSLDKINFIRWIPLETKNDELDQGYMEFNLETDEYIFGPVYLEDYYSAYRIWFGSDEFPPLQELGEGVGLVGIHKPESYQWGRIWNIVINPYIADLELGWSSLLVDALPICSTDVVRNVKKFSSEDELEQVENWLNYDIPSTWKIIDIPIKVSSKDHEILLTPTQSHHKNGSFLSMQGFIGLNSKEFTSFHDITPALINSTYEYYRVNEFAKVFALFQLAKQENIIVTKPMMPQKVNIPKKLMINHKERKFISPENFKESYTINFEYNDVDIKETSDIFYTSPIDEITDLFEFNSKLSINIEGHTDNIGSEEFNNSLGLRRANNVKKELVSKGIPEEIIKTKSFGEKTPMESNNSEFGRSKNRRVEINIKFAE